MPPEIAPTAEAPAAPLPAYDEMSSAFDELVAPEPADKPAAAPAPAAPATDAADPAPADPAPADPAPADPAAVADPAPADPAPEADPAPAPEKDWKAEYERLAAERATPPADPEPAPAPAKAEPAPAVTYTTEEQAVLAEYQSPDWEIVRRGAALERRAEYNEIIHHVFAEMNRVYGSAIARGATAADQVAEGATLTAIRGVHADYDDAMYDSVNAWAEGLTGMARKVAMYTISEGEPEDVIELITEYKATRAAKPKVTVATPTAAPAAKPAVGNVTELSPQAKKAAGALSVVDSKRSNPTTGVADKNDFEGGWAEAIASGS